MRSRIALLFVLALVCAAGAAYLVMQKLQQMDGPAVAAAPPPPPTKPLLVATRNLPTGSIIGPADVRVVAWPTESLPVGAMEPDSIAFGETVVRMPIAQNTPIIDSQITQKGTGGAVAYVLPPGRVAATIRVTNITGVAGMVAPGNYVDVLFTHTPVDASGNVPAAGSVSETLLVHIKVLAVDQIINDVNPEIVVVEAVTLEVSPKEAEILALASTVGVLSLSLNSAVEATAADMLQFADVRRGAVPSYTTGSEISAVFALPEPTGEEDGEVQSAEHVIYVFRGAVVQEVSMPIAMRAAKGDGQGREGPAEILEASGPSTPATAVEAQGDGGEIEALPEGSAAPATGSSVEAPQNLLPDRVTLRRGPS